MGKKLYTNGDLLSVTITFPPQVQEVSKSYVYRKTKLDGLVQTLITDWVRKKYIYGVILYPEITWQGLIHYHGTIHISNPKYFANEIAKLHYHTRVADIHFDLDTISHPDIWDEYCKKDVEIMGCPLTCPDNWLPEYPEQVETEDSEK